MIPPADPKRQFPRSSIVVAATCIAILFAEMIRQIARTGPLTFHAPSTVLSNGRPEPRQMAPYLAFLSEVRRSLPPGAAVSVVAPADDPNLLVAIGQLPKNRVVLPDEAAAAARVDYVAVYRCAASRDAPADAIRWPDGCLRRGAP
ncbi:MAG TPA: hypothetical protein VFS34_04160 [Thermoanaerobaculia bacterium]|nr:hypothetical protein [Thermoanaerobaculia bacterium]